MLAEAVAYVENNRGRMDSPRNRRLGPPISSAVVVHTVKQLNRRIEGTEKFGREHGAESMRQARAAHSSEDERVAP